MKALFFLPLFLNLFAFGSTESTRSAKITTADWTCSQVVAAHLKALRRGAETLKGGQVYREIKALEAVRGIRNRFMEPSPQARTLEDLRRELIVYGREEMTERNFFGDETGDIARQSLILSQLWDLEADFPSYPGLAAARSADQAYFGHWKGEEVAQHFKLVNHVCRPSAESVDEKKMTLGKVTNIVCGLGTVAAGYLWGHNRLAAGIIAAGVAMAQVAAIRNDWGTLVYRRGRGYVPIDAQGYHTTMALVEAIALGKEPMDLDEHIFLTVSARLQEEGRWVTWLWVGFLYVDDSGKPVWTEVIRRKGSTI